MDWSDEKLIALSKAERTSLRRNADRMGHRDLVERLDNLNVRGRSKSVGRSAPTGPVIGYHFICPTELAIERLPDGQFLTGVWKVAESQVARSMAVGAYVALHTAKTETSYLMGEIVGWSVEKRNKGDTSSTGITFTCIERPTSELWYGAGAGEKGYRYDGDDPA
ncbi:hypothetical protein [Parvularcula sp. LCG005]|uniref:hypothetical protein n=1 Tax=Parvularcula sp. LCG005 TaxID=3078805 RepID=UPI00294225E5|nr:hypothetical protein [Parvularcula sp. LCG005]WOI52736.1 hypothetical protein RUI03_11325 [Parvularcula sp. LCG005]